jgi:hypothetical protein
VLQTYVAVQYLQPRFGWVTPTLWPVFQGFYSFPFFWNDNKTNCIKDARLWAWRAWQYKCWIKGIQFYRNNECTIWVFRAQADWTLTHTSYKDIEQSTTEASITLDGVTLTDSLIRWTPNEWPSICREIPVSTDKMFWTSNKPAQWTLYRLIYFSWVVERRFQHREYIASCGRTTDE